MRCKRSYSSLVAPNLLLKLSDVPGELRRSRLAVSFSMSMTRNRSNEAPRICAAAASSDQQSGIRCARGQRLRNADAIQYLGRVPQRQDCLAVPVLILDEFKYVAVQTQRLNRFGTTREYHRIEEHRGGVFECGIDLERLAFLTAHAAQSSTEEASDRAGLVERVD